MRILLFLYLIIFTPSFADAQRERDHWYFGNGAGLLFNGDQYIGTIGNSQMNAPEGCASISDPTTGELLFYSNGVTVWNRNHEIMENGEDLSAHTISTNSAYIFRKPGYQYIYYLFTMKADCTKPIGFGPMASIKYSEIDVRAANGLGSVIEKDVNFLSAVAQKVTAIPHANGVDQWIILYRPTIAQLVAVRFSEDGPQERVTYNLPETFSVVCGPGPSFGSNGNMSAAPNGNTFAFVDDATGTLSIFRFDAYSGEFSNEINIDTDEGAYGVAFSSNSTKLYVSFTKDDGTRMENHILQYDLSNYNKQAISNSEKPIISRGISNQFTNGAFGAMQLGPDDRIYVASSNLGTQNQASKISVIRSPNSDGISANVGVHSISLSSGKLSTFGLPQFQYINTEVDFDWSDVCIGEETAFKLLGAKANFATWNFGDPDSGSENMSTETTASHTFSAPGEYEVTAEIVDTYGNMHNITNTVSVYEYPTPNTDAFYEVESFFPGSIIPHSELNSLISNDLVNETIEYYYSISEAELGVNRQPDPVTYSTGTGYAKVINNASNCYTIVPFEVNVIVLEEDEVETSCFPIFPTAFSPNNSGMNDFFLYFNTEEFDCQIEAQGIEVFNRWGENVYEGIDATWNGLDNNGNLLQPGVYVYQFTYSFINEYAEGENLKKSGTVHLLK